MCRNGSQKDFFVAITQKKIFINKSLQMVCMKGIVHTMTKSCLATMTIPYTILAHVIVSNQVCLLMQWYYLELLLLNKYKKQKMCKAHEKFNSLNYSNWTGSKSTKGTFWFTYFMTIWNIFQHSWTYESRIALNLIWHTQSLCFMLWICLIWCL